jgi:hypothetical protein
MREDTFPACESARIAESDKGLSGGKSSETGRILRVPGQDFPTHSVMRLLVRIANHIHTASAL